MHPDMHCTGNAAPPAVCPLSCMERGAPSAAFWMARHARVQEGLHYVRFYLEVEPLMQMQVIPEYHSLSLGYGALNRVMMAYTRLHGK